MVETESEVRLTNDDFELLLPGKPLVLGKTTIIIRPLGLAKLKAALQQIESVVGILSKAGISFKKLTTKQPDKLMILAKLIMENCPELLATASGVHVDDIKRISLTTAVEILSIVLDVNIESQEGLEKNLKDLAVKIRSLRGGPLSPEELSGKQSKNLSQKAIRGKKSKRTPSGK